MEIKNIRIILISLLAFVVIYKLLSPLVYAIVLVYIFMPLYKKLEDITKHKTVSALVSVLLIFFIIIMPFVFAIKSVVTNPGTFQLESYAATLLKDSRVTSLVNSLNTELIFQKFLGSMTAILLSIPKLILNIFVMLATTFFFFKDHERITGYIHDLANRKSQRDLIDSLNETMKAIIIGNFAAATIIGFVAWIFLKLLGFEYAILMGAITGLSALVPILGVWLVYVPLMVYEVFVSNYFVAITLFIFWILLQVMELYLAPRISGAKIKIHPGIMLFGFIGGPLVFGIEGLVLGPLILGVFATVLKYDAENR